MALTQRLQMRQSQALVMTPQLMQAIKLLQLSNLDLAAYVEGELERNPLLERAGEDEPAAASDEEEPEAPDPIRLLVISGDEALANDDVRALAELAQHVLVIAMFERPARGLADVLLPGTSYLERDGTMVNLEGRPQRGSHASRAPGAGRAPTGHGVGPGAGPVRARQHPHLRAARPVTTHGRQCCDDRDLGARAKPCVAQIGHLDFGLFQKVGKVRSGIRGRAVRHGFTSLAGHDFRRFV